MEPRVCVCVCVCVWMFVSVSSLQPKRMNRLRWNFPQIIWQIFASVIFRGFWNFEFDDVMAAILHFCVAALSRSQFWSDFLQIWTQVSLTHAGVCYWKSARSVGNFRWLREPRFTKNRFFGAKIEIFEIRQAKCRFILIRTRRKRIKKYLVDWRRNFWSNWLKKHKRI